MEQIITLLFLIIFPFGQIVRIGIIHPIDIIVGVGALYVIYKKHKKPIWFIYFDRLLIVALFSWILSVFYFRDNAILYGFLYLVRLFAYFYFAILINRFIKNKSNKSLLLNSLITLSLISSLFGWIQLIKFPDLKPFFEWGWDEHLFRLAGTFLDPTFLGLIIVFGMLLSIFKKKYFVFAFLAISLLFTYSRASYLAFFAGLMYLAYQKEKIRKYLLIIPVFLLVVIAIPTNKNHSINFFRTFSAIARVENYKSTLDIYKKSPIFGVGYNNLCFAKNKYVGIESYKSHACSGSDSSILFIMATTGIVGLFAFIQLIIMMSKKTGILFHTLGSAMLVHSLFSNSIFYSWILGYLLIVFVLDYKE